MASREFLNGKNKIDVNVFYNSIDCCSVLKEIRRT
jgi:hypothetical protein